jgi:hypothetical protein
MNLPAFVRFQRRRGFLKVAHFWYDVEQSTTAEGRECVGGALSERNHTLRILQVIAVTRNCGTVTSLRSHAGDTDHISVMSPSGDVDCD